MSAKKTPSKSKNWLVKIPSVLLFILLIQAFLQFARFNYLVLYVIYALPGIFGLLYIRGRGEKYKTGTIIAAILALIISVIASGGTINLINLILWLLISIGVM